MSDVTVRELTPELVSDYFQFFDERAFTDNPEWSGCYCYLHHFPGTHEEWQERTGTENRAAVQELIRNDQFNGVLAYVDDLPVGWCKADIRAELPDPESAGPPVNRPYDEVGVILCFNVAPDYRGRGVARELLDGACRTLAQRGASTVEGYPLKEAETSAELWHGPLSVYESAGFASVMEDESRVLMRKSL